MAWLESAEQGHQAKELGYRKWGVVSSSMVVQPELGGHQEYHHQPEHLPRLRLNSDSHHRFLFGYLSGSDGSMG